MDGDGSATRKTCDLPSAGMYNIKAPAPREVRAEVQGACLAPHGGRSSSFGRR
jgi:hypothetical protein